MQPTSSRSARGPAQTRTGHRRNREILALLAALACLASFVMVELKTSPSGPAASPPQTVKPGNGAAERLGAVSWPADGVSAAAYRQRRKVDDRVCDSARPSAARGRIRPGHRSRVVGGGRVLLAGERRR